MSDQKNHNQDHMAQATTDVLKDPVCGMTVTEESKYHEEFKGKTYFFCSDKCQSKFHSSPVQYIVKLLYYSYKIRKKLEITHRLSRSTILYAYV